MKRMLSVAMLALVCGASLVAQVPQGWKQRVDRSMSASDPDGQTITALVMDASGLPSGHHATFVAGSGNTSGTFSWQPGSSDSGSWKVTFRATANGASGQAVTSIRVTNVDRAPVMTAPGTVRATRGSVATEDPGHEAPAQGYHRRPS